MRPYQLILSVGFTAAGLFLPVFSWGQSPSMADLKKGFVRPTEIPYAAETPYSPERESLGKALFFDPRLSGSNMISCATCHNPSFSWGDGLKVGVGHSHKALGRRSPFILNLAWSPKLMWDGRAPDLEAQALGPIESEAEMNMKLDGAGGLVKKLSGIAGYKPLFEKAFPGEPITTKNVGRAIGVFERGIISGEAPFDRFIKGDESAISEPAKRGFVLFNTTAKCVACHAGWSFTDGSFHDIGVPGKDIGRGKFVKLKSQQSAFKTPGLRNVALRGPYMHDGSESSLEKVIELYEKGGRAKRPSLSDSIKPLKLSVQDKGDLLEFLNTLTSVDEPITFPVLPR